MAGREGAAPGDLNLVGGARVGKISPFPMPILQLCWRPHRPRACSWLGILCNARGGASFTPVVGREGIDRASLVGPRMRSVLVSWLSVIFDCLN